MEEYMQILQHIIFILSGDDFTGIRSRSPEYRGSTGYGKGHYEKLTTADWKLMMF